MKKFSIITILVSTFVMVSSFILPYVFAIITSVNSPSVGIIGGTDLPPLFLYKWNSSIFCPISLFSIATLICGIITLIFNKSISQNCSIKSSAYALLISALISLTFYCIIAYIFIGSWHDTNVTFSASHFICILLALLSLIGCIILGISYAKKYICDKKYKRIIFDIAIIFFYFVPFLIFYSYLHSLL